MMFLKNIILLLAYYSTMAASFPLSQSSQNIKKRAQRNVDFGIFPLPNYKLWTEELTNIQFPPHEYFEGTQDFSSGFDYDPLLISRREDAERITKFLYSKELFFCDIPHFQLLLSNQNERKLNGLAPHRLGSIRIHSPFDISNQRI